MTFQEFRQAVLRFAGERYCAVEVQVSTPSAWPGRERLSEIEWACYVEGCGWHRAATPEAAIADLAGITARATEADVAAIGEVV